MRIVALVAVVAVLVAGGFWLARDRDTVADGSTTNQATTADAGASGANASTPPPASSQAQDSDEPDQAPADAGGADAGGADAGGADTGGADDPSGAADNAQDAGTETDGGSDAAATDGPPLDLTTLLPVGYAHVDFLTDEPRRSFTAAEQVLEDGFDYVALLHTNRGDIVVDLYEDLTPVTVNNFVFLTLNRFYQGVPFHRVLEDFMAQTGDPTGTGSGGPGYQFDDEIVDGVVFDSVGQLAMANAGAGTNGSQFFITFAATPWLTGAHTIFGEVMSGVEVLDAITRVDPSNPSAIVMPTDTLADLAAKGIDLPGDDATTVEAALEAILGTSPVLGQSFTAAGYRGVMGQLGADPAYGFFPQPDTVLDVLIGARATE